jgi:hypothetical protein
MTQFVTTSTGTYPIFENHAGLRMVVWEANRLAFQMDGNVGALLYLNAMREQKP